MLAVAVGVFHGWLNGAGIAESQREWLGLVGIATAVFLLVALLSAFVVSLRAAWTRIAVRVAGSRVAAIGLLMLVGASAPEAEYWRGTSDAFPASGRRRLLARSSRHPHRAGPGPEGLRQGAVGLTFAIAGFGFSSGGVLTDPTLPVENVHADVYTPSIGVAHSFSLFGKTAQALAALPYSWAPRPARSPTRRSAWTDRGSRI